jgi:hypothetical protein
MSGKATPERLAGLVAEALWPRVQAELREALAELEQPAHDERIDAKQAAKRYGRKPRWWRDHADEFGAERDWRRAEAADHVQRRPDRARAGAPPDCLTDGLTVLATNHRDGWGCTAMA